MRRPKGFNYNYTEKMCSRCGVVKPLNEFTVNRDKKDGHTSGCKSCATLKRAKVKNEEPDKHKKMMEIRHKWGKDNPVRCRFLGVRWRSENPVKYIYNAVRNRAKHTGIAFDIELEDIVVPEFCPVLGIPLVWQRGKRSDNSPSLDRMKPELGYTKGNVRVISMRANRIKNDGTVEEHEKIVRYMRGEK
jgi:hypothetical protein